jgi:hypothetical protein
VYSRDVAGQVRNFEASGSLYHSALVMQDSASDSYWAVISSEAIGGPDQGTTLEQLPISEKMTWGEWKTRHPDTVILSVGGVEDVDSNPYENYFNSDDTFKEMETSDTRLPNKAAVFTFHLADRPYAVPHTAIEDGWTGNAAGVPLYLYRPAGSSIYRSTVALRVDPNGTPPRIDPDTGIVDPGSATPLEGLDTFWHIWSTYNPETEVLGAGDQL